MKKYRYTASSWNSFTWNSFNGSQSYKLLININENQRGPNYWKLNASLLKDKNYKVIIKDLIHKYNTKLEHEKLDVDLQTLWEQLKQEIRTISISYSKSLLESFKQTINEIERKIQDKEDKPANEIDMNEKKILENELSQLYDKKSKGAKIRSRVNKVDRIRLTF